MGLLRSQARLRVFLVREQPHVFKYKRVGKMFLFMHDEYDGVHSWNSCRSIIINYAVPRVPGAYRNVPSALILTVKMQALAHLQFCRLGSEASYEEFLNRGIR